jgi:hypothetical protein
MLDDLVMAFESEPQVVDVSRAAGFMQKVNTIASDSAPSCLYQLPQVREGTL